MMEPVVYLVDDDLAVRDSLSLLIRSIGLTVVSFGHPQDFLDAYEPNQVGCLVLDIRMPGINGLSVQEIMNEHAYRVPIIFITGHGDVSQCCKAFKAGAVDFLTKPIDEHLLLNSLQKAIQQNIEDHKRSVKVQAIQDRLNSLTSREQEVLKMVVDGLPNKTIAQRLDISTRTVETHRASLFDKLKVNSLAELVKLQFTVETL
jgi:RNA polymerase sigma factor (sigma-70 family)